MSFNNAFANEIINWYITNKRELPWRETQNPYKIWISEVILQQTRIEQGTRYYLNFIDHFPSVELLANASEQDVLKHWEGLGYYSRARNLHFAAKQIVNNFNGIFPNNYEDILGLKGIGPYTAAAISSIAYSLPYPCIDGNVYRVLSRLFTEKTPINESKSYKIYLQLINEYFDTTRPSLFNQAMMELGALVCKPKNPDCVNCPVKNFCMAFEQNSFEKFPIKNKKSKSKVFHYYYLIIKQNEKIFIEQRTFKGIWKNLFQFPMFETIIETPIVELEDKISNFLNNQDFSITKIHSPIKHILSHKTLFINFIEINSEITQFKNFKLLSKNEIKKLAFPVTLRNYIDKYLK